MNKLCKYCGQMFITNYPFKKFCSQICCYKNSLVQNKKVLIPDIKCSKCNNFAVGWRGGNPLCKEHYLEDRRGGIKLYKR